MKWIVFQHINSHVAPINYYNSIKIAYFLNLNVVSVGLDYSSYYFCEMGEKLQVNEKLEHLIDVNENFPEVHEMFLGIKENLKVYNKIKSKSSQHILVINRIKKAIENSYKQFQDEYIKFHANKFDLPKLRELLDHQNFYFFDTTFINPSDFDINPNLEIQLLQFNLEDLENGNSLFFLSNFSEDGVVMEMEFLNPKTKEAEDKNTFYGELSYIFPLLDGLSSTELILTRKDLEKTTLEFRAKIDEWATICYANPNTNLGLEFFRKELQPFLQKTKNEVLENPFIKNVSSLTHKNLESQINIGEAPIAKIWELYLHSNTISQEVYDDLMKIKTEQYPKFEGRWPIVFFKPTEDAEKHFNDETQNDGVKSVRKSISLD